METYHSNMARRWVLSLLFKNSTQAQVWEISVRDFTVDSSSGVSSGKRGKYLGFVQHGTTLNGEGKIKTGIDYLVENHINCVQLMPVADFSSIDEKYDGHAWGYDPYNYNVPEGSFSSDPYHGDVRIRELKTMIQELHKAEISVIMDVVYNHTSSTSDSPFEMTVPGYYYRMNGSSFLNGSGCGNVTASDKTMFRKYMVDSVKYWVEEYHIDGFRFDLMGCHDIATMEKIRTELDKIDSRIITYGEPWMADWGGGNGISNSSATIIDNAQGLNSRIGCFNDRMRDAIKGNVDGTSTSDSDKGYIQGLTTKDKDIKAGCKGHTSNSFGKLFQNPGQVVTYASCHDNLTLWDKIVRTNGSTDYDGTDAKSLAMNKLSAALVLTSQGIAFTQAGEEMARTKYGESNSYDKGDSKNKISWSRLTKYSDLVSYYKGLREIRSVYSPFTDSSLTSAQAIYYNTKAPSGVVSYVIQNKTANSSKEWGAVAVTFNNTSSAQTITLESSVQLPASWATIVNGSRAGLENLGTVTGNKITVPARSALVLTDMATFNRVQPAHTHLYGDADLNGAVDVRDVTAVQRYMVKAQQLSETAVKASDVNGDNEVNVRDVTTIQKYIAGILSSFPVGATFRSN